MNRRSREFGCLLAWTPIRRVYITHTLGRLDETLAVAHSDEGGGYPPSPGPRGHLRCAWSG